MAKKKLKIAIYSGSIPSTTFIERLINGIGQSGHLVLLFGTINKLTTYQSNNIKNKGYRNSKVFKGLYLLFYSILLYIFRGQEKKKLDALLKSKTSNLKRARLLAYPVLWYKPDVFHVQWAKSLDEWIWVKQFGIKLILSLRGAHINYSPISDSALAMSYKNNFPLVDAFHSVSDAIAVEAVKYGASLNKIRTIYSGFELPELVKDISIKDQKFNIISVGRSHWKKGYVYALDAMKKLKDQGLSFSYTIIGGAASLELKYQIEDLNLNDVVMLEGNKSFDEVAGLIKSADLMLLPSVEEGLANVVIEAMYYKTLILSTNSGGMNELIKNDYNGYLVPVRDVKRMAEKVIDIATLSDEKRNEIITNAYNGVQEKHNLEKMINEMISLYESA